LVHIIFFKQARRSESKRLRSGFPLEYFKEFISVFFVKPDTVVLYGEDIEPFTNGRLDQKAVA
jgi:hypothetical protein